MLNNIIMKRNNIKPRHGWQKKVEKIGFCFHTPEMPYWDETAYYEFTMPEILLIEKATTELWSMCLKAVDYVIENKMYGKFFIPEWTIPLILSSWNEDHPSIYGRFDLCFKDGVLKMLEFNADTPTSLFEAAVIQWFWLQGIKKTKDQFNSIHEKLIAYWSEQKPLFNNMPLYFSCIKDNAEDFTTSEYLRDCAIQAGIETGQIFMDDIGWDTNAECFTDLEDKPIKNIFKLYPWEWMINEPFGKYISVDRKSAYWIEPAWKMILSNKAILPILWELFPESEYLLPAYFDEGHLENYVKKPILSREGANVELITNKIVIEKTEGEYGEEGFIYQESFILPEFRGNHPLIGSWIIGQQAAGIGIRESKGLITNNTSRFIPHLIL